MALPIDLLRVWFSEDQSLIQCQNCNKCHETAVPEGAWVKCSDCNFKFYVRYQNELDLLDWVTFGDYSKVDKFLKRNGIEGYSQKAAANVNRIFEFRRWQHLEKNSPVRGVSNELLRSEISKLEQELSDAKDGESKARSLKAQLSRESQSHAKFRNDLIDELDQQRRINRASQVENAAGRRKLKVRMEEHEVLLRKIRALESQLLAKNELEDELRDDLMELEQQLDNRKIEQQRRIFRRKQEEKARVEEKKKLERDKYEREGLRLKSWAKTAAWQELDEFMIDGGAQGFPKRLVDELVEIYTYRRWGEEDRIRRETQRQEDALRKKEISLATDNELNALQVELKNFSSDFVLGLSAFEFEKFIAKLFQAFGYNSEAVGGTMDGGIDVRIFVGDSLYAIAQCKRFSEKNISASQMRDFVGAYMSSKAIKAFFFTTTSYTPAAIETAEKFHGLEIYDLDKLKDLVASAYENLTRRMKAGNN